MADENPQPRESSNAAGEGKVLLRLEIQEAEAPLFISLTGEAVIGRRDPKEEGIPEIDLTSYGGYRKGVSRYHAVLHTQNNTLRLTDLGSRNGTFLNGQRIPARQTALIHDGDEVRLGQIVMRIYWLE